MYSISSSSSYFSSFSSFAFYLWILKCARLYVCMCMHVCIYTWILCVCFMNNRMICAVIFLSLPLSISLSSSSFKPILFSAFLFTFCIFDCLCLFVCLQLCIYFPSLFIAILSFVLYFTQFLSITCLIYLK